ncbi:MAG: hypothetical protein U0800_06300 [Isosphaeraceae bacterium]
MPIPKVRGRVTIFHGSRAYERHTLFEPGTEPIADEALETVPVPDRDSGR